MTHEGTIPLFGLELEIIIAAAISPRLQFYFAVCTVAAGRLVVVIKHGLH